MANQGEIWAGETAAAHEKDAAATTTDPIATPIESEEVSDSTSDPAAAEERPGLKAWIILIAGFVVHMFSFGVVGSYGVYQVQYLVHEFPSASAATISWIGTLMFLTIAFLGMFVGFIIEHFDARIICVAGMALAGGSMVAASFCKTPVALLLTQGLLFGFGASPIDVISIVIPAQYFGKHRALAVGVVLAGSGVAGIWLSAADKAMFTSLGRPWAMRITGLIMFGLGIPCSWLLKTRPTMIRQGRLFDFSLLRDAKYVLLLVASTLSMASFVSPFYYMPSYSVVVLGKSDGFGTSIQMAMNLTSLLSRIVIDQFSIRMGALNTLLVATFVGTVAVVVVWLPFRNTACLVIAAAIYGWSWGIMATLPAVVAADLYGPERLGTTLGIMYLGYAVGTIISAPADGAMLESVGHKTDYSSLIIYCGMQLIGSTAALVGLRCLISKKVLYKC
ncbi:MFS general substrate transporter [Martensiomyces pterosporus]|nr:MFS general substrate transporter [Martensiomyces pterosporus]